jgi:hypothetical protein
MRIQETCHEDPGCLPWGSGMPAMGILDACHGDTMTPPTDLRSPRSDGGRDCFPPGYGTGRGRVSGKKGAAGSHDRYRAVIGRGIRVVARPADTSRRPLASRAYGNNTAPGCNPPRQRQGRPPAATVSTRHRLASSRGRREHQPPAGPTFRVGRIPPPARPSSRNDWASCLRREPTRGTGDPSTAASRHTCVRERTGTPPGGAEAALLAPVPEHERRNAPRNRRFGGRSAGWHIRAGLLRVSAGVPAPRRRAGEG